MSNETRRAIELERRLAPLAGDAVSPEAGSVEDLALRVRRSLTPPAPEAAFITSSRARLLRRLPREAAAPRSHRARPGLAIAQRLAFAMASVLVAFALGTAGVAYAAQDAIPGDALYGVKRGVESVRWSMTTNPQSQAILLSNLASLRLDEVRGLAGAGREALIAATLNEYEQTLDRLQAVADTLPASARSRALAQAAIRVQQHQQVLAALLEQVAPQAQPAIERAIEHSSHSQQVLEALQQGQSPGELAPGQNRTKEPGPKRTPGPRETKTRP